MRTEGKGSRPHVFSLVPNASMRTGPLLDVAASSQEELKEWVFKIREVTMTSEAKVNMDLTQRPTGLGLILRSCHIVGSQSESWQKLYLGSTCGVSQECLSADSHSDAVLWWGRHVVM